MIEVNVFVMSEFGDDGVGGVMLLLHFPLSLI
jgi:hypothetical protein